MFPVDKTSIVSKKKITQFLKGNKRGKGNMGFTVKSTYKFKYKGNVGSLGFLGLVPL